MPIWLAVLIALVFAGSIVLVLEWAIRLKHHQAGR